MNTHVMYFSDHGDMHGSHGQFRKMTPYEEAVRVPLIIAGETPMSYDQRGCGRIPGVPVNHVDIAPTTLGLCGIEAPDWMQGTDYSHYRLRTNPKRKEPDSGVFAVRRSDRASRQRLAPVARRRHQERV